MEIIVVLAVLCAFLCCAGLAAGIGVVGAKALRKPSEAAPPPSEVSAER